MGLLNILLGTKPDARPRSSSAPPKASCPPASNGDGTARKDLLRLVEREVLTRKGIPQAWLTTETLRTTNARRQQGMHLRFLLRVWEPRLLLHGPALEQEFMQRLLVMDPLAKNWVMGFSWQFALPDTSRCPPLPHPGTWTGPGGGDAAQPAPSRAETSAGIIAGPVVVPRPAAEVRADLDRLLAMRSADSMRYRGGDDFAPTQPPPL